MSSSYDLFIAELLIRIQSPENIRLPDYFSPFITEHTGEDLPDVRIELSFEDFKRPRGPSLRPLAPEVFTNGAFIFQRYHWSEGKYVVRREQTGGGYSPCRLFVPKAFADIFCERGQWLNYLAMERMLLPFHRMILHASAVIYKGKAYLFSAPSGTGKSTHVSLWEKCCKAVILNGDKVVISVSENKITAYGSPIAGSSEIYCSRQAPVGAIFFLRRGETNKIKDVPMREGYLSLYSEAVKSEWDLDFNRRVLDMIDTLILHTPLFCLECTPEEEAVKTVINHIERKWNE